jgi:hypothetical protein
MTIINGRQIAPCIVAKVRYALLLTRRKPVNSKKCSQAYWEETVDYVFKQNNVTNENVIRTVKGRTDLFR